MSGYVIHSFQGAGDPAFALAQAVRQAVFIEEQHCPPDEEWDDVDATATHLVAIRGDEALATLRSYDDGGWLRIGRVAVLRPHRGKGIAWALLCRCLEDGRSAGFTRAFLNAQIDKLGLYERAGFRATGGEFMEVGIVHRRMEMFF
ncbi:MAG: GNAT family N-acetyltransferase [Planctomycetaceae bacterium]|nr:GNAT family N-acetyltransferase [Planctomycetaceae bacterium]